MNDRIALDDMTSDQLDQLYDRLKFTEDALARMRDRLEVTVVRVRNLAGRIRQGAPWTANDDHIADHIVAALDGDQEPAASCSPDVPETEPNNPAAWTPPPPGDRREQLPDAVLALLPDKAYLSTACDTAQQLTEAPSPKPGSGGVIPNVAWYVQMLHTRCRRNQKFTGQFCDCDCHQQRPAEPLAHVGNGANAEDCPACTGTNPPYPFICPGPDEAAEDPELTAEEARDLATELGTDLYRAQDALAFVEECCDILDREGRQPTTAMVREWLKGARCGRELAADPSGSPATTMARWLLEGSRDLDIPAHSEADLTGAWIPDPPIGCLNLSQPREEPGV